MVLTLALIEQAALIIRLCIVGLERDGLVQVGERLRAVTLCAVDDAAAKKLRRVAAVDGERLVVIGERQVEFAGPLIKQRAIGVGLGVVGVEADPLVEMASASLVRPASART